jgi:hypothetical protein
MGPQHRDTVTILDAHPRMLRKTHHWDGATWMSSQYDNAIFYAVEERHVSCVDDLCQLLATLSGMPSRAVVRGALTEAGRQLLKARPIRRLANAKADYPATLEECPRRWVAFDIDTVEAAHLDIVERPAQALEFAIREVLPPCFHDVSYAYQWTGSAGIKSRTKVKCRLWFWLDRELGAEALSAWFWSLPGKSPQVDEAVFRTSQLIYTAAPAIKGAPDPIAVRVGLTRKLTDTVAVPDLDIAALMVLRKQKRLAKAREQAARRRGGAVEAAAMAIARLLMASQLAISVAVTVPSSATFRTLDTTSAALCR